MHSEAMLVWQRAIMRVTQTRGGGHPPVARNSASAKRSVGCKRRFETHLLMKEPGTAPLNMRLDSRTRTAPVILLNFSKSDAGRCSKVTLP